MVACSKSSRSKHSSWMTIHISISLTPLLTIIVAAIHLMSPWQNISLNQILKLNSKTRSSNGLDGSEKLESSVHPNLWVLCQRATTLWTRLFDLFSLVTFVTAVITSFLQPWSAFIIAKSFSSTSTSKTALSKGIPTNSTKISTNWAVLS